MMNYWESYENTRKKIKKGGKKGEILLTLRARALQ
jgi:hypothetical protein